MEWVWIIGMVVLVIVMLVLVKKGYITPNAISVTVDALEDLKLSTNGSVLDKIIMYALYAFHAAEQLCYKGDIKPEEKNAKAVEMIPILASTDGYVLTDDDMKAAKIILEANCDMQPHSAISADDIAFQLETDGYGNSVPDKGEGEQEIESDAPPDDAAEVSDDN